MAILIRRLSYDGRYNWRYNRSIKALNIAPILLGMALLGDRGSAILIAGRLNCGRSILNQFDYMKATELLGDRET